MNQAFTFLTLYEQILGEAIGSRQFYFTGWYRLDHFQPCTKPKLVKASQPIPIFFNTIENIAGRSGQQPVLFLKLLLIPRLLRLLALILSTILLHVCRLTENLYHFTVSASERNVPHGAVINESQAIVFILFW